MVINLDLKYQDLVHVNAQKTKHTQKKKKRNKKLKKNFSITLAPCGFSSTLMLGTNTVG